MWKTYNLSIGLSFAFALAGKFGLISIVTSRKQKRNSHKLTWQKTLQICNILSIEAVLCI